MIFEIDDRVYAGFKEFCLHSLVSGGPDPHMRLTGWLCRSLPMEEKLWMISCYVGVYNFPVGERIWQEWPWQRVLTESPDEMVGWVVENWKGLALRRERRAVRTPAKLSHYLVTSAEWLRSGFQKARDGLGSDPLANYEAMWKASQDAVWGLGRYSCLRLLESYARYCDVPLLTPDVRPQGGHSPRETLAQIYPSLADRIRPHDDSRDAVTVSNLVTVDLVKRLADDRLPVDTYRIGSLLCEYHQQMEGRQYPGRANESEIKYIRAIEPYWGSRMNTSIWQARRDLHAPEFLGELQGWEGVRPEPERTYVDHGYVWSDALYSYTDTIDFSNPALRVPYPTDRELLERAHAVLAAD